MYKELQKCIIWRQLIYNVFLKNELTVTSMQAVVSVHEMDTVAMFAYQLKHVSDPVY